MTEKLWGGRFDEKTDEGVEAFTSSINVDKRLYPYDIDGSIAHCRMLAKCGIITAEEASTLTQGLEAIRLEIQKGQFGFSDRLEDIHMHIESRLAELVGAVSQKLHTARSRNDQVALDVRLYLKDASRQVLSGLAELRKTLVGLAVKYIDMIMPGYTHLQRAQPVLFSHHLMAYYEMFERDAARFAEGMTRIDVMPLGSAALAGTPHPIDRHFTAGLLGFSKVSENSIDSVSDRDFMIEFLSSASICMMHLSRFSEELVLWSTAEFGFIELSDAFATGSSIMPQKKNPDVPELIRGKSARVFGSLVSLLVLMKGLPLSYNRDMQEDKAPLFDAADTLTSCIHIFNRMLSRMNVRSQVMGDAVLCGFMNATDMADYLVARGMPFREAHGCAGKAVAYALKNKKELHDLTLDEMKSFSGLIGDDIFQFLTPRAMIDRRRSWGGTATDNVRDAIQRAQEALKKETF
ncbi:MAG: argininosuccinate lyase [Desulfobacterales bacterium]|jgi:argininosuccinate lyase|nr:argininosuccinate lyase [Desulfobacterales bacterium]